jgi:hypothetical protein
MNLIETQPAIIDLGADGSDFRELLNRPLESYKLFSVTEAKYTDENIRSLIKDGFSDKRSEDIPVSRLRLDRSISDDVHRDQLAKSLLKGRGQISSISVRCTIDERGEIVYDVIDGFHRGGAVKVLSELVGRDVYLMADVSYHMSDEELADYRILAANSVRSISFARRIIWMHDAFQASEWSHRDVTLLQLFNLGVNDITEHTTLPLTPQEIESAKIWVNEKCKKWDRQALSIYQDLKMAEHADPQLIEMVRVGESGGSHENKGVLTPTRLRVIVEELPNEYDSQWIAVDIVCKFNFTETESRLIARAVKLSGGDPQFLLQLRTNPYEVLSYLFTKQSQENFEQIQQGNEIEKARLNPEPEQASVDETPADQASDQIGQSESFSESNTVSPVNQEPARKNYMRLTDEQKAKRVIREKPHMGNGKVRGKQIQEIPASQQKQSDEEMKRTAITNEAVRKLEQQVATLRAQILRMSASGELWFTNIPDATQIEQQIMNAFFGQFKTVDDIAETSGLSREYVIRYLQSACSKRALHEQDVLKLQVSKELMSVRA